MDENQRSVQPGDRPTPGPGAGVVTSVPDDHSSAAQPVLPFDDEADQPIAFALTARARRTVAPASLPSLTVVEGVPGQSPPDVPPDEDPSDTRPARARALRRAGLSAAAIASRLATDELLVRGWVGETVSAVPSMDIAPEDASAAAARAEYEGARRAAADEASTRLAHDAPFAATVGLLAAVAEPGRHALTLAGGRAEVVARGLASLREHAEVDRGRVRVVVRAGTGLAADAVRHDWATRLEVEAGRITVARWPAAPAPDAVEVLVRVHDPRLAARVGGWCDALLATSLPATADLAF